MNHLGVLPGGVSERVHAHMDSGALRQVLAALAPMIALQPAAQVYRAYGYSHMRKGMRYDGDAHRGLMVGSTRSSIPQDFPYPWPDPGTARLWCAK
jgi:hypothetical protein